MIKAFSKSYLLYLLLCLLISFVACQKDLPAEEPYTTGRANVPALLTVGDGFLAAYYNGGLNLQGQEQSPGRILHQQLSLASSNLSEYQQAFLPGATGSGGQALQYTFKDTCQGSRAILQAVSPEIDWQTPVTGAFHEITVPFMSIQQLHQTPDATQGWDYAPYLQRLNTTNATDQSFMDKVLAANQTYPDAFKVVWLGFEDVLQYARLGGGYIDTLYENGAITGIDVSSETLGVDYLTDEATFKANIQSLTQGLFANNMGNGIICNVPDVREFPFLNITVPNLLNLDTIRLDTLRYLKDCSTYHPVWIKSDRNKDGIIDTVVANTETDRLLLHVLEHIGKPLDNGLFFGLSKEAPLHNAYVLDRGEQEQCLRAMNRYNRLIGQAAEAVNVPVFDTQALFEKVRTQSVYYSGIRFNNAYITGHFFDLHAQHLTPRGNALLANEWIRFINQSFDANIPQVDVTGFDDIVVP